MYFTFTAQAVVELGLPIVRFSAYPVPTRPSAKYQVLLTGPVIAAGTAGEAWMATCVEMLHAKATATLPIVAINTRQMRTSVSRFTDAARPIFERLSFSIDCYRFPHPLLYTARLGK